MMPKEAASVSPQSDSTSSSRVGSPRVDGGGMSSQPRLKRHAAPRRMTVLGAKLDEKGQFLISIRMAMPPRR